MANTVYNASRTVYVHTAPGRITAWHLRDFVRALDLASIPDGAYVHATHDWNTHHFDGMWIRENDPAPVTVEYHPRVERTYGPHDPEITTGGAE